MVKFFRLSVFWVVVIFYTSIFVHCDWAIGQQAEATLQPELDSYVSAKAKWLKTVEGRKKLLSEFGAFVYGAFPNEELRITQMVFKRAERPDLNATDMRQYQLMWEGSGGNQITVNLLLYVPVGSKPRPVIIGYNYFGNQSIESDTNIIITRQYVATQPEFGVVGNVATASTRGVHTHRWPLSTMLNRGYAVATIHYADIAPDHPQLFRKGIAQIMPEGEFGAVNLWALGLKWLAQFLATLPEIDKDKMILVGHSRHGKAALWAAANIPGIYAVFANNSGCAGAKMHRYKHGELIRKITTTFPHWFTQAYKVFSDRDEHLPIDQHLLLSLILKNGTILYLASAQDDLNAGPVGEYWSFRLANQLVYRKSLSKSMPRLSETLAVGHAGYHIRAGKHDILNEDWLLFLQFMESMAR